MNLYQKSWSSIHMGTSKGARISDVMQNSLIYYHISHSFQQRSKVRKSLGIFYTN